MAIQAETEKTRNIFLNLSLIIFGISLICPTYCTNVKCSEFGSGTVDLLLGWFAALFLGGTYLAWFANPFFVIAILTNKKFTKLSLVLSLIAFIIALTFLRGGKVLLNEAGHEGYITKFQIGYWFWLASMFLLIIGTSVTIVRRNRATKLLLTPHKK
jgi:hypothetical protein